MLLMAQNNIDLNTLDPEEYDFANCYTRRFPDQPVAEYDLIVAMLKHNSVFGRVARELGRTRSHIEGLVSRNTQYLALHEEIRSCILDEIEGSAMDTALAGDKEMQRFMLRTIGAKRGYADVKDANKGNENQHAHVDLENVSDEAMKEILEKMDDSGMKLVG